MRSAAAFALIDGALFGIKAAVLVIVVEALIRIGKRALKIDRCWSGSRLAFVGIFFLDAAVSADRRRRRRSIGYVVARTRAGAAGLPAKPTTSLPAERTAAGGTSRSRPSSASSIWWAPVALAALMLGPHHVLVSDRRVLLQARGRHLRRRLCACSPTWRSRRSRPITG